MSRGGTKELKYYPTTALNGYKFKLARYTCSRYAVFNSSLRSSCVFPIHHFQYNIRNQRTRLPHIAVGTTFMFILIFVYFIYINNNKYLQYDIQNQRTQLPQYSRWYQVSATILKFVYFMYINSNKYSQYVVDNILFGISVPGYPNIAVRFKLLRLF